MATIYLTALQIFVRCRKTLKFISQEKIQQEYTATNFRMTSIILQTAMGLTP